MLTIFDAAVNFFLNFLFESSQAGAIFRAEMTQNQFSLLDETQQAEVLIDRGVLLTERQYKNFTIFLYQVDHFYVELYFNLRFSVMQGMRSFEDDEALEPYLDSIDITALYN